MSEPSPPATARPENFYWVMSESAFMYTPTRTLFERATVVRQISAEAALLVEKEKVCSNVVWFPGLATVIQDKAILEGELEDYPGNNLFNLYKPPKPIKGDPAKAKFWLDLGLHLWGDDLPHLLDVLAFKVQHPEIKINHAILLGSFDHGIGKDMWLSPVRRGVGAANWRNISASHALKGIENNFTPFLKSSILRVSEVHEMGAKRFAFYDSTKDWCASPPETLTVADKHVKEHSIMNAVLVIFTSNHKNDGLHIPAEDRRTFVAWSSRKKGDLSEAFWSDYDHKIKHEHAAEHVAAYLATRDISKFNPGAAPPKTAAWEEIVANGTEPAEDDLRDLLDKMGFEPWDMDGPTHKPDAVTIGEIVSRNDCPKSLRDLFTDPGKRRVVGHRMESAGYGSVTCPDDTEGRWRVDGRRQMVYARNDMSRREQVHAVRNHVEALNAAAAALARARKGQTATEQAAEDFGE